MVVCWTSASVFLVVRRLFWFSRLRTTKIVNAVNSPKLCTPFQEQNKLGQLTLRYIYNIMNKLVCYTRSLLYNSGPQGKQ